MKFKQFKNHKIFIKKCIFFILEYKYIINIIKKYYIIYTYLYDKNIYILFKDLKKNRFKETQNKKAKLIKLNC